MDDLEELFYLIYMNEQEQQEKEETGQDEQRDGAGQQFRSCFNYKSLFCVG